MITKIKMFIIRKRAEYYADMCRYYSNKSVDFVKLGRYDEAEDCRALSTKYMLKTCDMTSRLVGTVL